MIDFIAEAERKRLEHHAIANFDALWALQLDTVDEPNTARGGWSGVSRLDLDGQGYYLKRQVNYLTRTLARPLGEPTLSREFRNIQCYARKSIPALDAVFYGERKVAGQHQAILLTRALDGWRDLEHWLKGWQQMPSSQRSEILTACGQLARLVHNRGLVHGCFYPKHVFLREHDGHFAAQLIDLEKSRTAVFGKYDFVRDLEPLLRRAGAWQKADVQCFLHAYLGSRDDLQQWLARLSKRRDRKAGKA